MHPSIAHILSFFEYKHLPEPLAVVSMQFSGLADFIAETLEGPEATVALRKLLEAKDCAVRAKVQAMNRSKGEPREGLPVGKDD